MSRPIIVAQNLTKKFDNFTAVEKISFEIMEGECFGFLGPNGAGKTSTMKMIYCFSPVTQGSLTVFGEDVRRNPSRIKSIMGVVPQDNSLDPDLTVIENLKVYARYFNIPPDEAVARADELLRFLQLEEKRNAPLQSLSGGMKRRLVIARSLINAPKILVLDEPTTALDPQARQMIWKTLRGLKRSGVTMVLTTHYMDEAAQLCDRLVIMNEGKILAMGTPQELIEKFVGKEVYEIRGKKSALESLRKTVSNTELTAEIFDDTFYLFLNGNQQPPPSLIETIKGFDYHHRMASLEDVFLKVTGRELKD